MIEPSGRRSAAWRKTAPLLIGGVAGAGSLAAFALLPDSPANERMTAVAGALLCGAFVSLSPIIASSNAPVDSNADDLSVRSVLAPVWSRLRDCGGTLAGAIAGQSLAALSFGVLNLQGVFLTGVHLLLFILLITLAMAVASALTVENRAVSRIAGLVVWLIVWSMLFWSRPWIMNARADESAVEDQKRDLSTDANALRLLENRSSSERDDFINKRARAGADASVRVFRLSLALETMPYSIYASFFRTGQEPATDTLMGRRTYDSWIGSYEKHSYPSIGSIFKRWLIWTVIASSVAVVTIYGSIEIRRQIRKHYTIIE